MLQFITGPILLIAVLGSFASPSFGEEATRGFSYDECESHLNSRNPLAAQAHRNASELFSWLTLRHPLQQKLMSSLEIKGQAMSLVFLTSGYAIPPDDNHLRGFLGFPADVRANYGNDTHFSDEQGRSATFPALRKLRRLNDAAFESLPLEPVGIAFVTMLLDRSLRGLKALAEASRSSGPTMRLKLQFDESVLGFCQSLDFKLGLTLWSDEKADLSRLISYFDDGETRRDLTGQVSRALRKILVFHRDFHESMLSAADVSAIRSIARETTRTWTANRVIIREGAPRIEPEPIVPALRTDVVVSRSPSEPVPRAPEIAPAPRVPGPLPSLTRPPALGVSRAFLEHAYEAESIEKLPLRELHRDLREGSAFLSATLARIADLAPMTPDWARWALVLSSSPGQLDTFEAHSRSYGRDLDVMLQLYAEVESDVTNLQTWLTKTSATLAKLALHERRGDLALLSAPDKLLVTSIHSSLPSLLGMTDRARASLAFKIERGIKHVDVLTNLNLLSSSYSQERLLGDGPSGRKALDVLTAAIAAVAEPE